MYLIYQITNRINNKIYIGETRRQDRWKQHQRYALGGPIKYPKHFKAIHAAIKKYGVENFTFEIIDTCKSLIESNLTDGGDHSHISAAKLTEIQVTEIINLLTNGSTYKELIETYKVSRASISDIKNGKTWSYLDRPESLKKQIRKSGSKLGQKINRPHRTFYYCKICNKEFTNKRNTKSGMCRECFWKQYRKTINPKQLHNE